MKNLGRWLLGIALLALLAVLYRAAWPGPQNQVLARWVDNRGGNCERRRECRARLFVEGEEECRIVVECIYEDNP